MSAYIKITLANNPSCAINHGLQQVLCYIGSEDTKFISLGFDPAMYAKGVEIINRRLRKWCKTPIKNLVYCKTDKHNGKYVWKIHRTKTVRVLQAIRNELEKKDAPTQVYNLFQQIYIFLFNLLNGDVERTEMEVLSRAFIRGVYSALMPNSLYTDDERKSLERIKAALNAYNRTIF